MRALLLLVVATSAQAQVPDLRDARTPPLGWIVGGAAAGAVAVAVGATALGAAGASDTGMTAAVLLYPVGAAAGIYGLARQSGRRVSLGRAARGAALGSVGLVAGGALVALGWRPFTLRPSAATQEMGALALAGLVIAVVAPPAVIATVVDDAAVTPVALVGPDGERAAGLALRVGL